MMRRRMTALVAATLVAGVLTLAGCGGGGSGDGSDASTCTWDESEWGSCNWDT